MTTFTLAVDDQPLGIMKRCSLFTGLGREDIQQLLLAAKRLTIPPGQLLFEENQPAPAYFLVLSGEIHSYRWAPDGEEKVFQQFLPGDLVAESAMFLDPAVYPMNARCKEKTQVLRLERTHLIKLSENNTDFGRCVLKAMGEKLVGAMNRIDQLTLSNAGQRLATYLLDLRLHQGSNRLRLPITYHVLAKQLAVTPETLSRLLNKFRRANVIDHRRDGLLEVHDVEGLCDLVNLPHPPEKTATTGVYGGCCNLSCQCTA